MNFRLTGLAAISLVSSITTGHAAGVEVQGTWETTLLARDLDGNAANGAEAYYDTSLNVTWLRTGSDHFWNWSAAKDWAEQDRFGLSGWRLPTTHVTTADGSCNYSYTGGTSCGFNPDSSVASGSEMSHLFFQSLGNLSYYVPGTEDYQPDHGLNNTGDFLNLQWEATYWSGTEYAPSTDSAAWMFNTHLGVQIPTGKIDFGKYALAVRPGDVTAVPEPETYALMLAGLGLIAGFARRRRKQQ